MAEKMAKGLFIALEGIDGAGTSTQLPLLADYVRQQKGRDCHTTAEPSRGPVGMLLRQALLHNPPMGEAALALLFAGDRLDHLHREVEPLLQRGHVVLTDRYLMSSYAYQTSRLPLAWVQNINAQARPPDLSIFFRVSQGTAARRRQARGGAVEHFDAAARQERVAQLYEQALRLPDIGKTCVIDAEESVTEVTQVLHTIIDSIVQGDG